MKKFLLIVLLGILSNLALAQSNLKGIVKDSNGLPVVGANVYITSANLLVITDENGQFNIHPPTPPYLLSISLVGFHGKELQILEMPSAPLEVFLADDDILAEVVITARRRQEEIQTVPISISVIGGSKIDDAGAFNVSRIKELVPSVQLYSSNPRNTTLNIRGLGSTFGLTNDGVDPGVGFYVDGVYYARPAVTTLDFIDVEQIEVLRGPQGTLFGKNTTAGAFNITSRRPRFQPDATVESTFGNYGFIQTRASITGPLSKKIAGRISISGSQRDGLIENIATQKLVNDLNNLGVRGQLLYLPSEKVEILLAADASRQRPDGYAQVVAGVVRTQRADYRQFDQIISDLNYQLPSQNAFDRKIDHDTPWRSGNDLGGISLNVDAQIGSGTLTSTTAWRYWNWDPSNDRDYTGLQVLSLSQATSTHHQYSQEIRYAGDFSSKLSGVIGVFALAQDLRSDPVHIEESGIHQWRFSQSSTSELWKTPGLFDGYGIRTTNSMQSFAGAFFGQLDWKVTEKISVLPGLRWSYDEKQVAFRRVTYGGLQTTDPALIALKNSVYNDQEFNAEVAESNLSGQVTVAYRASDSFNAFTTYSNSFKPVGINLGGLPRENGETMLHLARIEPEFVTHYEFGIKTSPNKSSSVNIVFYNTDIKNFQTLVQTPDLSVNRGYLANAERVRVMGMELDGNLRLTRYLSLFAALAYTDGKYVSFTNAPVPIEEVGGEFFKDISGGVLPGISKLAGSFGGEILTSGKMLGWEGNYFLSSEVFYRSAFSSSPSPSEFMNIEGYAIANLRAGFRAASGLTFFAWTRNFANTDYFELLLPGAGNAGHYAGVLGDPRTLGVTVRYNFKIKDNINR